MSTRIPFAEDIDFGELMAASHAVQFGKDLCPPDVHLEGDSLIAVRALSDSSLDLASFGHVAEQVRVWVVFVLRLCRMFNKEIVWRTQESP
ncbi:hypothetical protein HYC85_005030 [Camellia sinensis]|uniref:RNase H type-1 domain-containing protein n=1 Tax=Camellia sinensis TaxID=4442 RepID=A0A7J7HZ89_CAMSI|nr:hypothetical protein HYC85_005030 [Camellia sinensis]